ncbi:MAG: GTP-binding protein, partial [Candidatus Binatia bacterium]
LQTVIEQVRERNCAAEVYVQNRDSFDGELLRAILDDRAVRLPPVTHSLRAARHDTQVSVATIRRGKIDEKVARLFLDLLALGKGDELYRVKGILALSGHDNPLLFQAVRSNFHELISLDQVSAESGLTVIGRNIAESGVNRLLAALEHCSSNEV